MKNSLLNFWQFCNSIFLQTLLLIFAYISWEKAIELGSETKESSGYFFKNFRQVTSPLMRTDNDVTAGFDGGALAMGLITSMCIFGIVWLQVNKSKT